MLKPNSYRAGPTETGRFGDFGGRYVAETLMPLILELGEAYRFAKTDKAFQEFQFCEKLLDKTNYDQAGLLYLNIAICHSSLRK